MKYCRGSNLGGRKLWGKGAALTLWGPLGPRHQASRDRRALQATAVRGSPGPGCPVIARTPAKSSVRDEAVAGFYFTSSPSGTEGIILGSVLLFQESTTWPKPPTAAPTPQDRR